MSNNVISLDTIRNEHRLRKEFPADYELAVAFHLAKKLHQGESGEKEGELSQVDSDGLRTWLQKRLADEVEQRNIRTASVYKMLPYVAKLVASSAGLSRGEWRPVRSLVHQQETSSAFDLLRIAQDSFFVFCFYPESRIRTTLKYRQYAFDVGTQAYRVFGHMRRNPFGRDMEAAFAPLGTIVREKFPMPS